MASMGKSGVKQKKSAIYVRQVASSSHVTGLNLLLVGENYWAAGFETALSEN